MASWKTCIQINGTEFTTFVMQDTVICDELYAKAMRKVESAETILGTEFEFAISAEAGEQIDIKSYIPPFSEYESMPELDEFDDEEDYNAAVEEYMKREDEYYGSFEAVSVLVDDPGALEHIRRSFVGKRIIFCELESRIEYEEENGFVVDCLLNMAVNKEGIIVEINEPTATVCVGETDKTTKMEEILPDYQQVEMYFEKVCLID